MFEESSIHQSSFVPNYYWNPSDHVGSLDEIVDRKELPWQCPACQERFRWDEQLLRHENKTGHYNENRQARRLNKYRRKINKTVNCNFCHSQFKDSVQRVQHMHWCLKDPRSEKNRKLYESSFPKYPYECCLHEVPHYFQCLQRLKEHIKTHRKFDPEKIQKIKKVFRWRKKWNWRGLKNLEYKDILEKFDVKMSFTTLRKMFKKA